MKKTACILLFCFMSTLLFAQQKKMKVEGVVVHDNDQPIANVNILIKGSDIGTQTDQNGSFSIMATQRDVLLFSFVGLQSMKISLKKSNPQLRLIMYPKEEELDEVVVKKKLAITQQQMLAEFTTNKSLIKTTRGIISKDLASFSIRIIDGEELIQVGTDFLYSLQNLVPSMRVIRDSTDITVYLQSWSSGASPTAIFDVDGIIYEQVPTFINASDIDRVAILVRSGAIARYGPAGTGGVIIINTKSTTWMDEMGREKNYDNTALQDSLLMALSKKKLFVQQYPKYMKAFEDLANESEAIKVYELQKEKQRNSPYFFLEMANYFNKKWSNPDMTMELLKAIENENATNIAVLKATAYHYENIGQFRLALAVYIKILNIESRSAQSHRDLANAYNSIGDVKRALFAYTRYETAINQLDSIPFEPYGTDVLMTTESSNVISLNLDEFKVAKKNAIKPLKNPPTRILFEWSEEAAEFDVQLETPEGYVTLWINNNATPGPLLKKEKAKGYMSKQFFLNEKTNGAWRIHMNYTGNIKKSNPTYFKITTYFNYGEPEQKQFISVFKLAEMQGLSSLFTVNTHAKTVSEQ